MPDVSLVDELTGQILEVRNVPAEDVPLQAIEGRETITVEGRLDPRKQYLVEGEVTDRPSLTEETVFTIAADGLDEIAFDVPAGTEVLDLVTAETAVVDDGAFVFATSAPGQYRFRLRPPFPHQSQQVEITAND